MENTDNLALSRMLRDAMDRQTPPTGKSYAVLISRELCKELADRLEAETAEIKEFAKDVANQFGYHSHQNGRLYLTTGGLSTLEWAFQILGWENPHPDPENECEVEGCRHYASCGTPTKEGYKRLCTYHFFAIRERERRERESKR